MYFVVNSVLFLFWTLCSYGEDGIHPMFQRRVGETGTRRVLISDSIGDLITWITEERER